ncbi:MAG TPA: 23S rRNA (uracil(1939)-C(5))-methyltransferase RlmD [Planctomycetes bacterium]|nr:23S rRNA (uracil(1939)-C(5))-methyltransferase RlmD [Planctomycetota bacterium]
MSGEDTLEPRRRATGRKPRRGDLLEAELTGLDGRGRAVGRAEWTDGREVDVRVRGGVPGARVRVDVFRRKGMRVEARIVEVLRTSPVAVEPRCEHVSTCGGCSFQNIDYAAQLAEKHRILSGLLAPLGDHDVQPVLANGSAFGYRNKMDFTFGNRRWVEEGEPEGAERDFAVGLHVPGRYDKILDIRRCEIAFEAANPILGTVRRLAREHDLDAWDVREHRGLLRHLVLRHGVRSGDILVDLVTTERAHDRIGPFVEELLAAHPEITTLVQRVDSGVALVARGEEEVLFGPGYLRDSIGGIEFRVSAASFFQTNTVQAERLVELVLEDAAVREGMRVFDLYCGSGLFSLALARAGAQVIGFELVEEAVADARENARRARIEGVEFVAGDLARTLAPHAARGEAPELCVVDPPRAGIHPSTLAALRSLAPERIVYVSCNPKSAVRDLILLLADGYAFRRIQPVDLFPHTPHLECVFTLVRRAGPRGPGPEGPGGIASRA